MQLTDLPKNIQGKVLEVPSGCWEWQGSAGSHGYGDLHFEGQHWLAHRFVYACMIGVIPSGAVIRHSCDNRKCCNPAHLQSGTHLQNVLDKEMRGRGNAGSRNGMAKFTHEQVEYIRTKVIQGASQSEMAREFKVHRSCIHKIVHGTHWRF